MVNILGVEISATKSQRFANLDPVTEIIYYSKIRGIPSGTEQAPNRRDFGSISKLVEGGPQRK
jgi:hypothetical protein